VAFIDTIKWVGLKAPTNIEKNWGFGFVSLWQPFGEITQRILEERFERVKVTRMEAYYGK
jgi:hypothetical protein